MPYKVLSKKVARIFAAMAGGVIPRGGSSFEIGAADIEDKWLPRTDYLLSKMPRASQIGMTMAARVLNYAWPILYMKKFRQLIHMEEMERTELFHLVEKSPFPGPLSMIIMKVLIFPAFYGVKEVRDAIGYKEKFEHKRQFEGIKD